MAQETQASHRSGRLKQQNKSHKHGRHRTKSQLDRESQGRVDVKTLTRKRKAADSREVRRNQAKQIRSVKREQAVEKKRRRGGQHTPPHFVVVVSLSGHAESHEVVQEMSEAVGQMEGGEVTRNEQQMLHCSIARFKQRLSFFVPSVDNVPAVLDAAKAADTLLFVMSPEEPVDERGEYCLKCLMAQGLPASLLACRGLKELLPKKAVEARKAMTRDVERLLPGQETKVWPVDTEQEAVLLLRKLTEGKTKSLHFREIRPHLVAESLAFDEEDSQSLEGTLKLSGYLRGADLSADRLVHIVGWGTFQIAQITSASDPHPLILHKKKNMQVGMEEGGEGGFEVLAVPDPKRQESLQAEVELDPMEEEQTWPTTEELQEAKEQNKKEEKWRKKLASKGISSYQAEWLTDADLQDDDDDSSDIDEAEKEEGMEADSDGEWEDIEEEDDNKSVAMTETTIGDENYDVRFDVEEEKRQLELLKSQRMNDLFPDEMDTPFDVPARQRFARYRGLESFRTSPWDVNEDLPYDYQRIIRLTDEKKIKKRILKTELQNSVLEGQYLTIHVKGVPKAYWKSHQPGSPVVMFGLLPSEQMMSVLHFIVKRDPECSDTVKSKSQLVFQVGFRRFSAGAIISTHKACDKQLMLRFLPQEGYCVMSVFAPVTFGPCPVLVFQADNFGCEQLVASGSLLSVDPNRLVIKRIILSGDQFRMGKKKAVIRFMFFNREDIEYFKKIALRTKFNRRGRIVEPLGTHGHMKCVFNGQAKSHDVVLMDLYKRVYPKWTYQPVTPALNAAAPEEETGEAFAMFD